MARKITDEDIVEALTGTGAADRDIVGALRGTSVEERRAGNAILEALGHSPEPVVVEGELPLQQRGDELEAVAIWAAKEAAERATQALVQALMRTDGNKGIYAAESEARDIAAEAYAAASQSYAYEDERQKHVGRYVTKMAERVTRLRESSSAPETRKSSAATASVTEAVPGKRKVVTISNRTGQPITYYR